MTDRIIYGYKYLSSLLGYSAKPLISINTTTSAKIVNKFNGKSINLNEILNLCPSLKGDKSWYTPTFWLTNGHASTIYCTIADTSYDTCIYSRTYLQVPDGGTIALDFSPPISEISPVDERPILVLLHGLTGGSHESYIIDLVNRVTKPISEGGLNFRALVVNFRGCAGAPITSQQLYHGGYTDDLRCALAYISQIAPEIPLFGAGFSLGANVLAKYMGEEGDKTPLKTAIILGAPWDFLDGHVCLSSSWIRGIYSKAMASNLRNLVQRHKKHFLTDTRLDLPALFGNPNQTLYEFDSQVTRILGGFPTTEAYYRYASANQHALNVRVPLLSISSMDDPIVGTETVPIEMAEKNENLVFVRTKFGGHLGWWTNSFRPRRWCSLPCVEWLSAIYAADPSPRPHLPTTPLYIPGKVPKLGDEMVLVDGTKGIGFKVVEFDLEEAVAGDEGELGSGMVKGL